MFPKKKNDEEEYDDDLIEEDEEEVEEPVKKQVIKKEVVKEQPKQKEEIEEKYEEVFVVQKEIPTQEVRAVKLNENTVGHIITIEEALTEILNRVAKLEKAITG